ncbi:hypothetical protein BASA81_001543 [Batrachochytrium salamandrivorans]|nr:hypothetical protein BASA81_001543 [Batrachochytrium salamandrivorans]
MPPHARQTPAQRKNYPKALANLKDITAPHIQAFDYAVGEGFAGMVLQQQEFEVKAINSPAPGRGHTLRIWFEQVSLGQPLVEGKALFPRECRERGLDYSAELQADFVYQLDGKPPVSQRVSLGQAPVMVLSKKCRLHALSPEKLVTKGEDAAELGGYFIASGNERLLRYFQLPKRNIPQAIVRGSNRKFGEGFTDYAVAMRCVRAADQQSSTLTIHYSRDGTVYCRIRYRKIEYFIPLGLMLKALAPANEITDEELFQRISRGDEFIASRIELELRKASDRGWKKTKDALEFMGSQFKDRLADACAPNATPEEMGQTFIDLLIFIHLDDAHGKLECLVEMARKLYAAVQESCGADDPDAFDSHELLLGGHLYLQSAKEMLEDSLGVMRKDIEVTMAKKGFELAPFLTQLSSRLLVLAQRYGNVGRKLFSILATGSIAFSKTGLDMAQVGGFSIIADKLNRLRKKSYAYFPTARVIARVSLERDLCSKSTEREQRAICPTMEVAMILKTSTSNTSTYPYPGLFLSTGQARMIRPVIQLKTGWVELIGPLEQVFLKIACARDEIDSTRDTYVELDVASIKTQAQDTYMIDEYPNGCNAVVCVISYTGYDMDDAMIINKSSMERGFGHASVYTTVDLEVEASSEEWISNRDGTYSSLDTDGLPQIGTRLKEGDYLCSIWNNVSQRYRVEKFKDSEPAVVLRVKMMEPNTSARSGKSFKKSKDNENGGVRKASITLRYDRNPTIGDKFSSRHGQKGVLSVLWPQQDMPFSESGMTPDVIINPHAFPSRMTIGMLVESLAGKAGALHGKSSMDATPFTMQGDNPGKMANDYLVNKLLDAGYSYYGSEPMYSGVFGAEMHCDIFIGVVYYQRLRHMVLDKSQVRATGPVDLRHCQWDKSKVHCRLCGRSDQWKLITVPYAFRYLTNELAGMGIRLEFKTAAA